MSCKSTLVKLLRTMAVVAAGLIVLGLGGVMMCSTYPTYKGLGPDCTAADGFELQVLDSFDGSEARWFSATDYTSDAGVNGGPGVDADPFTASASVVNVSLASAPLCGNPPITSAGLFRASHNNDWGCLFGFWGFTSSEAAVLSATGWEGLAFWARGPGSTTKSFTMLLDDNNTASNAAGARCRDYIDPDAGVASSGTVGPTTSIDPGTGTALSGSGTTRAPYPDECGNGYTAKMTVTADWQFYVVPFSEFQQVANPNRVAPAGVLTNRIDGSIPVDGNGLVTAELRRLGLRMGKEAEVELWIANLSFYRKKAQ